MQTASPLLSARGHHRLRDVCGQSQRRRELLGIGRRVGVHARAGGGHLSQASHLGPAGGEHAHRWRQAPRRAASCGSVAALAEEDARGDAFTFLCARQARRLGAGHLPGLRQASGRGRPAPPGIGGAGTARLRREDSGGVPVAIKRVGQARGPRTGSDSSERSRCSTLDDPSSCHR